MMTRGQERRSEVYSVVGSSDRPVAEGTREWGPEVRQSDGDVTDITYAAGRTISLGNYEFARVMVTVRGGWSPGDETVYDAALDAVRAFATAVLAREEAEVRGRPLKGEAAAIPALPGVRRLVGIEYGLTLNAGVKFESHKIECGITRPLADGEDAVEAVEALQEYLSKWAGSERDRLRGSE